MANNPVDSDEIFQLAEEYRKCYPILVNAPDQVGAYPALSILALAVEVYLKALHQAEKTSITPPRGHDCPKLYDALGQSTKTSLEKNFQKASQESSVPKLNDNQIAAAEMRSGGAKYPTSFSETLNCFDHEFFVSIRYRYEENIRNRIIARVPEMLAALIMTYREIRGLPPIKFDAGNSR